MAERVPINPGRVEWSGDNPGIYLKRAGSDPFVALSLFFKVVLSPHGRGTAMLVLGEPESEHGWPEVPNIVITDNQALSRYLLDNFVRNMPTFRGKAGLQGASFLPLTTSRTRGDPRTRYAEIVESGDLIAEMVWDELGTPFAVEVNADQSATGTHEMYSIFVEAKAASITLDGKRLGGHVANRQLFGRTISTAFLAFSETWVKPGR
jgi:hypothetical protein